MVNAASTRNGATSDRSVHADTLGLADRLRLSATRLARRLRQESGTDLTPSQLAALASVERHGPLTLGSLAEVEQVAPPSVTKVVTKLEAAGLVTRTPGVADRRVAWVAVTPGGAKALARIRKRRSLWLATRLAALDEADRARLAAALDVLEELAGDTR
jgi:DNA-binding MarR family transcriptional regulator